MQDGPITVLLVDDSPMVRSLFAHALSNDPGIQVVGGAKDPYEARELIIRFRPTVIVLDIEMPRMDGMTFLRKLMAHYPVPVIMCSGATSANSQLALEAIDIGAVDVVIKPSAGGKRALIQLGEELAGKIRAAAVSIRRPPPIPETTAPATFRSLGLDPERFVVALGASTGGTDAIRQFLSRVPADFPPLVMVQHMPEAFTAPFADRLNLHSAMTVREAKHGEPLKVGTALLARGGRQMTVRGRAGAATIVFGGDELVNRHCPSVDVLFDSVARQIGKRSIGVLLTGMGADGANGLLKLRQAGALTAAQDQNSCVVYGMPKVAAELGAVELVGPPTLIPSKIENALKVRSQREQRMSATAR